MSTECFGSLTLLWVSKGRWRLDSGSAPEIAGSFARLYAAGPPDPYQAGRRVQADSDRGWDDDSDIPGGHTCVAACDDECWGLHRSHDKQGGVRGDSMPSLTRRTM